MTPSDLFSRIGGPDGPFARLARLPEFAAAPLRGRALLVLNHVVMQEPEAIQRLARYAGRTVQIDGFLGIWPLTITPAGLFEEAVEGAEPQLRVKVATPGPLDLAGTLLAGARPRVSIDGDADLAAVFAWLAENLRWDYEEDFSRLVGDAPAHVVGEKLRALAEMLRNLFAAFRKRDGGAS